MSADWLRLDLLLLALALAWMTAGICHLAIAVKRIVCHVFSECLNGCAIDIDAP